MREVDAAAARVRAAMRALDVYRHDGAPTLEREYRRALEAYFVASERAAGHDVTDEADDADVEDDAVPDLERLDELQRDRAAIAGHYGAAKRALRLARAYRAEPQSSGRRERECVLVAQRHREAIRSLRLRIRPTAEQLALPGLAKTRPSDAPPVRVSRTG